MRRIWETAGEPIIHLDSRDDPLSTAQFCLHDRDLELPKKHPSRYIVRDRLTLGTPMKDEVEKLDFWLENPH